MSLEEEVVELSTVYHGQRARMQRLERLLRDYYELLADYEEHFFFHASEEDRSKLQRRAKDLLQETPSQESEHPV